MPPAEPAGVRTNISRSLHTQQLAERAARRLLRPHSPRRVEAGFLCGRKAVLQPAPGGAERYTSSPRQPRIVTQKPLPGFVLPLRPCDVRLFLTRLGPAAAYGLREVRLRRECLFGLRGVTFAEYILPGRIDIYTVPASPWRLAFVPPPADLQTFRRYAARVDVNQAARQTTVWWEPDGLTDFFLYEVLAHEIGHHVLQHHRGKRPVQVCRRAGHEACADLYARRVMSGT